MSTTEYLLSVTIIAGVLALICGIIGWVLNIIEIFSTSWDTLTAELVIRLVGVPLFAIGAVAGWV